MFTVNLDVSALVNAVNEDAAREITNKAAASLALLTQAKVTEMSTERLHTRRDMFLKGVSMYQEGEGTWVIHLDNAVHWIEDGREPGSMLPDLLNSPKAKTSSDGHKYIIVPFVNKAGKGGPTQNTPYQQDLVNAIKAEMKKQRIPWGKIEKDSSGNPKLGKLHSLKVKTPLKTREGPGMGWGAIGDERKGATGIPFLAGANVFQTKNEKGKVERGVITFRIASDRHYGTGRWHFPGLEPANIFADSYEWAQRELDEHILPEIMRQIQELNK